MAFSDWTALVGFSSTPQVGTAFLNSGLADPLIIGSTYCRRFEPILTGGIQPTVGISAAATYAGGALVNVPNSKAIRLQGYLRLATAPSVFLATRGIWLAAKMPSNFFNTSGGITSNYAVAITSNAAGAAQLSLVLGGAAITFLEAAVYSQWYGLRLDVFPIGTAADRLIAYKETTPGSGTWTVLTDVTVLSTSAGYVPWSQNRKNGLVVVGRPSSAGGLPETVAYADLVTVAVGNAPVPIP